MPLGISKTGTLVLIAVSLSAAKALPIQNRERGPKPDGILECGDHREASWTAVVSYRF